VGVDHVTVTVNALDADIAAQIYPWLWVDGSRLEGRAAAAILLERQQAGIRLLTARGILVKINSVLIPGINDRHLPAVGSEKTEDARELADVAAAAGYAFYLAGHTHGGQICLPGGRPIVTQLTRCKHAAVGLWREAGMTGYTSSGLGVSDPAVRFNSRGEVTIFTLRRAENAGG